MLQNNIAAMIGLIAVLLGALQARAQLLRFALSDPTERPRVASLTNAVTLAAWTFNVVWLFRSWPWYWAVLAVAAALASGNFIQARAVEVWFALRHLTAIATLASAGLLWTVFYPAAAR